MKKKYHKLVNSDPSMLFIPDSYITTEVITRVQLDIEIIKHSSSDDLCGKLFSLIIEENSALRQGLDLEIIPKIPTLISDSFFPSISDESEVTHDVELTHKRQSLLSRSSLSSTPAVEENCDIRLEEKVVGKRFSTITTPSSSRSIYHYISHLKYAIHRYLPKKKKGSKIFNTQKFLTCRCFYSHSSRAFIDGIYFLGDPNILIPLVCIGAVSDLDKIHDMISPSANCSYTYSDLLLQIWLLCDFTICFASKLLDMSFQKNLMVIKKTKRKLVPKLLFFRNHSIPQSLRFFKMSGSEDDSVGKILGQEDEGVASTSAPQQVERMDIEEKGLPMLAQDFLLKDSPLQDDGYFPGTVLSQAPPSDRVITYSNQQEERDLEFPSIFKPSSSAFAESGPYQGQVLEGAAIAPDLHIGHLPCSITLQKVPWERWPDKVKDVYMITTHIVRHLQEFDNHAPNLFPSPGVIKTEIDSAGKLLRAVSDLLEEDKKEKHKMPAKVKGILDLLVESVTHL